MRELSLNQDAINLNFIHSEFLNLLNLSHKLQIELNELIQYPQ